jgi:hypothetical protein
MITDARIAEPVFLRNLVLYPIQGSNKNGLDLSTLDEVLPGKKGVFRELAEPDVNEIIFDNNSDQPVLMIDGEEIVGSLQNRIMAQSSLVKARSSNNLQVVCVEEGRWQEIGGFQTGDCSYPRVRTMLTQSRHRKTDSQKLVWQEIERKLTASRTISATSSMHDIFNNLKDEVNRYLEDFGGLDHDTTGFIGTAGRYILGLDIFANNTIYKKFENRLIRSYALDAIEFRKGRISDTEVGGLFSRVQEAIDKKRWSDHAKNIRIKGAGFYGQAIAYKNQPVHISTFPT